MWAAVVRMMRAITVVWVMCAVVVRVMWAIRVIRVMDTIWVIDRPVIRMEATWSMSSLGDSVWVCGVVCAGVPSVVLNWAMVNAGIAVWGVEVSVFALLVVTESVVTIIKLLLSKDD